MILIDLLIINVMMRRIKCWLGLGMMIVVMQAQVISISSNTEIKWRWNRLVLPRQRQHLLMTCPVLVGVTEISRLLLLLIVSVLDY